MPSQHEEEQKYPKRKGEKRKLNTDSGEEKKKLKRKDVGDILEGKLVHCEKKTSVANSQEDVLETDSIVDSEKKKLKTDCGGDVLGTFSGDYWKDLAEERRVALEEALLENQKLTERVNSLQAENRDLEEMLGDATTLAEMINTMTAETVDESGIGKDIDTTLNTSTETESNE